MDKIKVSKRNLDTKLYQLRTSGVVPGVLYGPSVSSRPVKMSLKELLKVCYDDGVVYELEADNKKMFAKLGSLQRDPVTQQLVHFSLVQLNKNEKNEVDVPITLKGVPIGQRKGGTFIVLKDHLHVHAMVRNIPENVDADISSLDIGDKITVGDLDIPKKVEVEEDNSEVVAICKPPSVELPSSDDLEQAPVDETPKVSATI